MDPTLTTALVLFIVTYILIFALEKWRPYVACISAAVFVVLGSISLLPGYSYGFLAAVSEIDWNVLLMIAGTMGTVQLFIDSGMPMVMSELIIEKVPNVKWMVVILSLFAGIISAFVDNVATVLMIAPVAVAICRQLKISPVPVIICISISSNLQGAATLVGDTTSILLAKTAGLDFADFFFLDGKPGMFWITQAGAVVTAAIIYFMFRKENAPIGSAGRSEVKDKVPAVLLVLTILTLIGASFIPYKDSAAPGQFYKPEISNGLISMFYFLVGLTRACIKEKSSAPAKHLLGSMDYYTLFLLTGLFVIIGGIKKAGIIDLLASLIFELCGGDALTKGSMLLAYTIIVWMSVLASAFIDNIPYVATMLPVVEILTANFMQSSAYPFSPYVLFFGLLVGATLGGNITPVGASANITAIGILRKEGEEVKTGFFMKYSVPFTLASVTAGYVLVWLLFMPGFFK